MTHDLDGCGDLVKPASKNELLPKTVAFYRFTLDKPISGARGKSYDEQVEAVKDSVTSLDGVTYSGIGGSTGLDTFEYLLEVAGAGPVLAGAESARIDPSIIYPRYRDGQVPDLAPNTHMPALAAGEAAFLDARTRLNI